MKVVLTGWKPGLKKISLYGVLVKSLNISITVAKQLADDLIAGKVIELEIDADRAPEFVSELEALGVICHTKPDSQTVTSS